MKNHMRSIVWRYIASNYLYNLVFIALVLLGLIAFFDVIELLRRASKFDDVPFWRVLQMAILKLPEVGQTIFPFVILFSAIFTFWHLNRRYEVTIFRTAGYSVWQFAAPVIAVGFGVGILMTTVINPVGTVLIQKFNVLENNLIVRDAPQISYFANGLWLRQPSEEGYIILHSRKIDMNTKTLQKITVLSFDEDDTYKWRIDSPSGQLSSGVWEFKNASFIEPAKPVRKNVDIKLPTDITASKIRESFADAPSLSFWKLPSHIRTVRQTGFDAANLRIHYQNLLAQPFLFASLILIAACVTLRPPRTQAVFGLIVAGVAMGFVIFFLSNFLQALGASHQIAVPVAAWAPFLITAFFGTGIILMLEDG
tara:strand:- start:355 stop:1455 length:1101 start_codon:yes stop_codon:yes gene_type:complete